MVRRIAHLTLSFLVALFIVILLKRQIEIAEFNRECRLLGELMSKEIRRRKEELEGF